MIVLLLEYNLNDANKLKSQSNLWAKENKREKELKVAMSSLQLALT